VVVSGLPRSGTSMVMQMLSSGGLEILKDDKRKADADNPKGYFEYSKVKTLAENNSWLREALGKGLKVVSPLLSYLPSDYQYRLIFVERDLDQILASQAEMIKRQGIRKTIADPKIKTAFGKHLKEIKDWLKKQKNFKTLFISYQKTIDSPVSIAKKISLFLKRKLDLEKMTLTVNPSLYRQRS